jgi:hypothetical protein
MAVSLSGTDGLTFNDATTQNTSAFYGGLAFRNRIINGAMVIDQRNSGALVTAMNVFTVDRWAFYQITAGTLTAQQISDAPTNYVNSLKITTAVVKTTAAGDYFNFNQKIEGYNITDLNWGTANALSVTLSFWVKSSLTGTFGGCLANSDNSYSNVFQYTINAASTWEQKTITIAGPTIGTWQKTTSAGISVIFSMGDGSTYSTTTPNTWVSGDYRNINTNVRISANAAATWQITGVQLEKGSTATSFDYRPYGTELALCQRYFYNIAKGININVNGYCFSGSQYNAPVSFPVQMRTGPSLVAATGSGYYVLDAGAANALTSPNIFRPTQYGALLYFVVASGAAGYAGGLSMENAASSISFSSEL